MIAPQVAVTDILHLQWRIGAGFFLGSSSAAGAPDLALVSDAGLLAVLDVFAWVPELYLGGGVQTGSGSIAPRGVATLGLRRFVSFEWSLGLYAGVEYVKFPALVVGASIRWGEE